MSRLLTELEENIFDFIEQRGNVRTREIAEEFGEGEYDISVPTNMFIACGFSYEVKIALRNLINRGIVFYIPDTELIESYDPATSIAELIYEVPRTGYVQPFYLPCRLYTFDSAYDYVRENFTDPDQKNLMLLFMHEKKQAGCD
ncbi:MAG: hypothetical protein ACOX7X_10335 [Methanosarcina flavescens]|jgi:hypothetical protein|uniref:Uncharacterized protein n=1 Tax=Methanosarcina flavescens TaxID=1715806 RepID=A0A660HNP2_9EURY|nr:hypothetical protein [Methanosarcina flavescens]AYK13897.1 hypothetical protein AOB57_000540 [Methanosarcina flavescens]NLK33356.1 hypothetical protein [Methanosarcina flavescens]